MSDTQPSLTRSDEHPGPGDALYRLLGTELLRAWAGWEAFWGWRTTVHPHDSVVGPATVANDA